MDLKSIINKSKDKKQSFWALLIEPGWVSAAIWEVIDGEVNVVSQSSSTPLTETDNFVEIVDTALSSCITSLPQDYVEPEKTVFGVPSAWIDGGNIKPDYLEKLKIVCEQLSLQPAGFVVLSEAVAHFIKAEEGSPLSGVVVGVAEQSLEITLFKLGKLMGSFNVSRSVSVVDDLVEGLTRFGLDEVFPSRIVVYDGKDGVSEEVRNTLAEASWNDIEKVKFLHPPKVDMISNKDKTVAVCLAGGAEIAGVTKIAGRETFTPKEEIQSKEVENIVEPKEELTAQDLGFVVHDENFAVPQTAQTTNSPVKPKFHLPTLPKINLPKPKIKFGSLKNSSSLIIGAVSLVTFIIAGFLFWWFYPTALVTVYVSPKKLDESMEIVLGDNISSKQVEVEVDGEETKSTSGTKTVGDKAKGVVKIQNGTSNTLKLDVGSILTSSSGLKFVLDKSASVSAALSPSTPGTGSVEIIASEIGSDYNLAKDEIFKIGNYPKSDVDAVSADNFSGGSSRQISAVSADDISSLEESLINELTEKAKTELQEKISMEEILIEDSLEIDIDTSDFSNKIGDEASTLKLSLSIKFSGMVVNKKDLAVLSSQMLSGKVPSGFTLRDDQINYEITKAEEDEDKYNVDVAVNLLPNIDTTDVAKKVVGKYPALAQEYLSSVPGFVRAEFRVKPLFPGKLGTLPHVYKRISVELSADQ